MPAGVQAFKALCLAQCLLLLAATLTAVAASPHNTAPPTALTSLQPAASANATKKSFAVELQKADGKKNEFPLLGMPADSEWIL